jgi:FdhD protein
MGDDLDAFSIAILRALAEASPEGGMSLPRLGKRLGQGASVIMRGPGWVRVVQLDERWVAHITEAGRAVLATLPPATEDENAG